MKKNKTICLNEEIVEKLNSIENVSGLIEQLLTAHFEGTALDGYSKDELYELLEIREKRRELDRREKEMENNAWRRINKI